MKKKVLIIFFRPPYPPIGGDKIRMFQNLRFLSEICNLDALYLNDSKSDSDLLDQINRYCSKVVNFDIKRFHYFFNTLLGFLLNRKPLQVNYFYHKRVQKWIDAHMDKYDAVFVNTIRVADYVLDKNTYKIIDFIDAISMNYEKAAMHKKFGLWKLLYAIDKKRLYNYEKMVLNTFDRHLLISKVDKEHILKGMKNTVTVGVIPNAVYIRKFDKKLEEQEVISFLGKMDYEPNETAVTYFTDKVFPSVKKAIKNIQFNIIGIKPTRNVKKLGKIEGVNVLGYVENIEKYMLQSKLIIAPMVSGAGIQNKILQAMALGKCVVTTGIGAEGLPDLKGYELIICDTAEEMAARIVSLYTDDEQRNFIGINAKRYIEENFSEEDIKERFLNFLKPEL